MFFSNPIRPPFRFRHPGSLLSHRALSTLRCASALSVRVNKVLSAQYSRREADALVSAGRVKVNGQAAEHGMRIVPRDEILVDGKRFSLPQQLFQGADDVEQMERHFAYFKYWKPAGVTCTCDRDDPDNILDAIAGAIPSRLKSTRVFNVGRLDKDSTGLVLLTDDGRLPNALLRKEFKLPKVYRVKLDREPSPEDLDTLRNGVLITTEVKYDRTVKVLRAKTRPCEVRKLNKWTVEFVLTEGRNRQIRKMLETLRYRVVSLHRVSFCGIRLSPPLHAEGQLARLNADEMQIVRGAVSQWLRRRTADGQASSPSPPPPTGGRLERRPRRMRAARLAQGG